MSNNGNSQSKLFHHRQVEIDGLSIHVVEGSDNQKPAILFLHGWPESWVLYEKLMLALKEEFHVVAIDLPGVGGSITPPVANDKRTLAKYISGLIQKLGLRDTTLVGHDAGGQIAYAFLHAYSDTITRAVIMNTAVPGVDPWSEVVHNPHIWHFAFHAVPELPEQLVTGQEAPYFAFFYKVLAGPRPLSEQLSNQFVQAYLRPDALHTGFEWYRAFAQDEKDNVAVKGKPVQVPVLYLRGDKESRSDDLETYLKGFRDGGLVHVQGQLIENCGHFAPEEQPDAVASALRQFVAASLPLSHNR